MFTLRQLFAGTALAALAASSPAFAQSAQFLEECTQKYQPEHPLVNPCTAATKYREGLSRAFKASAKQAGLEVGTPTLFAGAFVVNLERDYLKQPADKMRIIDYPKPSYGNEYRAVAVIPPQGMAGDDIPVCLEKDKKVLGTFFIKTSGPVGIIGTVVNAPWSGPTEAASDTSSACKSFIVAARDVINQKIAQQPAQPPVPPLRTSALTVN